MSRSSWTLAALVLAGSLCLASCQPTLVEGVYGCSDDAGCPDDWRCALAAGPTTPGTPPGRCVRRSTSSPCGSDADCGNDSLACNGRLGCGPVGAAGADARGCVFEAGSCSLTFCDDASGCCDDAACAITPCAVDDDCGVDDGVACNGRPRCNVAAPEADVRGCIAPAAVVCAPPATCSEPRGTCGAAASVRFVNLRLDGAVSFAVELGEEALDAQGVSPYFATGGGAITVTITTDEGLSDAVTFATPAGEFFTAYAVPHYSAASYAPVLTSIELRYVNDAFDGVRIIDALDVARSLSVAADDGSGTTAYGDLAGEVVLGATALLQVRLVDGAGQPATAQLGLASAVNAPVTVFVSGSFVAHPQDPLAMRSLWIWGPPAASTAGAGRRAGEIYVFDGRATPTEPLEVCGVDAPSEDRELVAGGLIGPFFATGTPVSVGPSACATTTIPATEVTVPASGRALIVVRDELAGAVEYETLASLTLTLPATSMSMRAWNVTAASVPFEVTSNEGGGAISLYMGNAAAGVSSGFMPVDVSVGAVTQVSIGSNVAVASFSPGDYLTLLATPLRDVAIGGPRSGPLRALMIR